MDKSTQCQRVRQWMMSGKPISTFVAMKHLHIANLQARILDLKNQGVNITTTRVSNARTWWAEYSLSAKEIKRLRRMK